MGGEEVERTSFWRCFSIKGNRRRGSGVEGHKVVYIFSMSEKEQYLKPRICRSL